jgi:hypothetical protein
VDQRVESVVGVADLGRERPDRLPRREIGAVEADLAGQRRGLVDERLPAGAVAADDGDGATTRECAPYQTASTPKYSVHAQSAGREISFRSTDGDRHRCWLIFRYEPSLIDRSEGLAR